MPDEVPFEEPPFDEPDTEGLYVEPTGAFEGGVAILKGLFGAVAIFGALGLTLGLYEGALIGFAAIGALIGEGFFATVLTVFG